MTTDCVCLTKRYHGGIIYVIYYRNAKEMYKLSEKIKVAVIAGTAVDTQMGVDFLKANAPRYEPISCPVSESLQQQMLFEILPAEQKERNLGEIINLAKRVGAKALFVYCNALSASVDFDKLSLIYDIKAVTPLSIYSEIAEKYSRIGVLAANNQTLAGIELTAMLCNPNIEVIGASLLPVINQIEQKVAAKKIVGDRNLPQLMSFFEGCGVQAVILGCTHLPWLKDELQAHTTLSLIDPAMFMLRKLTVELS